MSHRSPQVWSSSLRSGGSPRVNTSPLTNSASTTAAFAVSLPRPTPGRSTQRLAADALLSTLRRTTTFVDERDTYPIDEVMNIACSSLLGLSNEVVQLQLEASSLRASLSSAYRSSATATAAVQQEVVAAQQEAQEASRRGATAVIAADTRRRDIQDLLDLSQRQLEVAQQEKQELRLKLDQTAAGKRSAEQHLIAARCAAAKVLDTLSLCHDGNGGLQEQSEQTTVLGLENETDSGVQDILSAVSERALSLTKYNQATATRNTILESELEAERQKAEAERSKAEVERNKAETERSKVAAEKEAHELTLGELRLVSNECTELSQEVADAQRAREQADSSARRLQSLMTYMQSRSTTIRSPASPSVLFPPPEVADATATRALEFATDGRARSPVVELKNGVVSIALS